MKNIFKWKKLGEVNLDGGIMIVSDAENFQNILTRHIYILMKILMVLIMRNYCANTKYPEMETVELGLKTTKVMVL